MGNVGLMSTRHITGHFADESFQAVDCTGTDNQTITSRVGTAIGKIWTHL